MIEHIVSVSGGKQFTLDLAAEFGTACNQWGACE
jgi:hypothetical protein